VLYCALNPATALLEILVHMEIDPEDRPERFQVLKIEGPDAVSVERLDAAALPEDWGENPTATQAIGDDWLASARSLLLEVPSVLAPETWNVLVNPAHPEAGQLKIARVYQHPFDTRLF
jgi:RES domain-containing protein